jgi:hypothetical protein
MFRDRSVANENTSTRAEVLLHRPKRVLIPMRIALIL